MEIELKRKPHENCEAYVLGECSRSTVDFNCTFDDKNKCPVYELSEKNKEIESETNLLKTKLINTKTEIESILNNNESKTPDFCRGQIDITERVLQLLKGGE